MVQGMKVLCLAAEASPLVKVGGLGDVVGELPPALNSIGVEVHVYIPFHQSIDRSNLIYQQIDEILVYHREGVQVGKIYRADVDGSDLYLIDGDPIAAVEGIYSEPDRDAFKFTFFSLAALEASKSGGWKPDILHAHDWHTSAAIVWLHRNRNKDQFWHNTVSLLTVHNLPYMGAGGGAALLQYGLERGEDQRLPEWAQHLPLPMGLATADWISAVSPTYSREIQTSTFGHGLENLINDRKDRVVGILNGIDLTRWDPERDQALAHGFSRENLSARKGLRATLLKRLGLSTDPSIPLLGMITRLHHQKGVDIVFQALSQMVEDQWQFILLGSGDPNLENLARKFAVDHPDRARSVVEFDANLARKIYAGADMILIPSRYEPCGLTQMIAMRYGCVPIVSATGGLKDTVTDYHENPKGTGFVFTPTNSEALTATLKNAFMAYGDLRRWPGLQRRGMAKNFSWRESARKYVELYERAQRGRLQN
jgi:starch synthase